MLLLVSLIMREGDEIILQTAWQDKRDLQIILEVDKYLPESFSIYFGSIVSELAVVFRTREHLMIQ